MRESCSCILMAILSKTLSFYTMSVSIAVYGVSSQVQWLLQLHCADKVARCIVLDILRDIHILVGARIRTYLDSQKLGLKNLVCLVFILCWFLSPFLGKKKGVKGVICSQDPCVFFSSVYVLLNVVVYLGGFCSCKKHKHQWHVNHIAN